MCHSEPGDAEKAVQTLSGCVKVSPNYSNAYVAIGFARFVLGDLEKAKEDFHRALEIDPVNSYALRNPGSIYGNEKDFSRWAAFLNHVQLVCMARLRGRAAALWADVNDSSVKIDSCF